MPPAEMIARSLTLHAQQNAVALTQLVAIRANTLDSLQQRYGNQYVVTRYFNESRVLVLMILLPTFEKV